MANMNLELAAMSKLNELLVDLEEAEQKRILLWACDAFGVQHSAIATKTENMKSSSNSPSDSSSSLTSFVELLELVEPKNNPDRTLVAGYWLQEHENEESFDGRSLNRLLKEHGIDVRNVTNAMASLIGRSPRLAMQAGKKGKFEKLYRLTTEGRKLVENWVGGIGENND